VDATYDAHLDRYQKVIEMAPSLLSDRELVASVIECALRMAERIRYRSLGTWEFLVSPDKSVFFFMEINPRLQVEHTITETICGVDLVRFQLLIAQGQSLQDLILQSPCPGEPPPPSHAIQLRLTAEDPHHKFSLSIGRINSVSWPGGNGVRVDTHTRTGVIVSADFDSLLGKIIISSKDWLSTVDKCDRALEDTSVEGITTNLNLLRAIVLSEDFRAGECDTGWLEQNLARILGHDLKTRTPLTENATSLITTGIEPPRPMSSSGLLVKKGDTFAVHLVGPGIDKSFDETLTISKVVKNDFPNSLITELTGSKVPGARDNEAPRYTLQVAQSSGTTNSTGSRKGDPENPTHLICPLAGQLVEMLVEEGDVVEEWEPVAIMRQMKMELEVRAQRKGVVTSLWEIEEGDDVGDGMLVCVIMPEERLKEKL
jgi:acetyl/propionyl-CoA carboxylase alpha subunit